MPGNIPPSFSSGNGAGRSISSVTSLKREKVWGGLSKNKIPFSIFKAKSIKVKNLAYLIALPMLLLWSSSCNKTYECTCYYDILVEHKLVNVSSEVKEVRAQSEKDARRDCAAHHFSTIDFRGNGTTARCSLNP